MISAISSSDAVAIFFRSLFTESVRILRVVSIIDGKIAFKNDGEIMITICYRNLNPHLVLLLKKIYSQICSMWLFGSRFSMCSRYGNEPKPRFYLKMPLRWVLFLSRYVRVGGTKLHFMWICIISACYWSTPHIAWQKKFDFPSIIVAVITNTSQGC